MQANSPHDISTFNSYYAYKHQGFLEVFDNLTNKHLLKFF